MKRRLQDDYVRGAVAQRLRAYRKVQGLIAQLKALASTAYDPTLDPVYAALQTAAKAYRMAACELSHAETQNEAWAAKSRREQIEHLQRLLAQAEAAVEHVQNVGTLPIPCPDDESLQEGYHGSCDYGQVERQARLCVETWSRRLLDYGVTTHEYPF